MFASPLPMPSVSSVSSASGTAAPGAGGSSYIPGLDGLRAVAFLLVFGAHATPGRISLFIPATLGVTIFFFLSGYLITTLLRAEALRTGTISLRDFYIRRTLRIFLPLYVAFSLAAFLARFAFHISPGNRLGFLSMLLYFYNYANVLNWHATVPPGLTVIWSLAVEEHFYLLFPLVYLLMIRRQVSRRRQVWMLFLLCLAALCWRWMVYVPLHKAVWTYFATDSRFDSILWGSILAIRNNPRFGDPSLVPVRLRFPTFVLGLVLIGATLAQKSLLFRETFRYTVQAIGLYLIFSFVLTSISHPSIRWLEWKAVRYLGWISYSLYLMHAFILYMLHLYVPDRLWVTAPLGFVLAVVYGVGMRYSVELPLQTLRARFRHVPEADPRAPDGHGLIS